MAEVGSTTKSRGATGLQIQRILLVRHGETDANRYGIVQGHSATSLNALGHQQARLLARRLAVYQPKVDVLVSSDLLRARQTAEPIAAALGLTVQPDAAWRERCYGIMEGKGAPEREKLRRELGLSDQCPPPGAQTIDQFRGQILEALHALPGRYPDADCIAVITHAGGVRAITMTLMQENHTDGSYKPCPNCSITEVLAGRRGADMHFEMGTVYDVGHLDESLTTSRDSG